MSTRRLLPLIAIGLVLAAPWLGFGHGQGTGFDTAARSLTGSGSQIDADTELFTHDYSFVVKAPAATDDFLLFKAPGNLTLAAFDCVAQAGSGLTTIDYKIQECNSNGATCADVGASATMTVIDTDVNDSAFTDTAIASGNWVKALAGTVTWTTPGFVTCTLRLTYDDAF